MCAHAGGRPGGRQQRQGRREKKVAPWPWLAALRPPSPSREIIRLCRNQPLTLTNPTCARAAQDLGRQRELAGRCLAALGEALKRAGALAGNRFQLIKAKVGVAGCGLCGCRRQLSDGQKGPCCLVLVCSHLPVCHNGPLCSASSCNMSPIPEPQLTIPDLHMPARVCAKVPIIKANVRSGLGTGGQQEGGGATPQQEHNSGRQPWLAVDISMGTLNGAHAAAAMRRCVSGARDLMLGSLDLGLQTADHGTCLSSEPPQRICKSCHNPHFWLIHMCTQVAALPPLRPLVLCLKAILREAGEWRRGGAICVAEPQEHVGKKLLLLFWGRAVGRKAHSFAAALHVSSYLSHNYSCANSSLRMGSWPSPLPICAPSRPHRP